MTRIAFRYRWLKNTLLLRYFRKPVSVTTTRLACLLALTGLPAQAGNWPHWLGPEGNNTTQADPSFNTDLNQWKLAWKSEIGRGYSSVSVDGNQAYTMGHDEESKETIYCFNATTGEPIWKHAYEAELLPRMHPGGPNATPTIIGGQVVTVSKDGQVLCLDKQTGEVQWKASLPELMGVEVPRWGFAGSPVIHDGQILLTGGRTAVLDLETGKPVWISETKYDAGYATPVRFNRGSQSYLAILDGKGLLILNAKDGSEVARRPFEAQFNLLATTPIILNGGRQIFISGNASSEMLALIDENLVPLWTSEKIRNAMNNSVVIGNVIYGIDGKQQSPDSKLVAVDLTNGEVQWTQTQFGYGNTIGVGKHLLSLTENGELIAIEPSPEGYREVSRRQVLGKLCWTTPTYANQRIYVRNDQGDVVCLSPL